MKAFALLLASSLSGSTPTEHEFAVSQIREGSRIEYVRYVRDAGQASIVLVARFSPGELRDAGEGRLDCVVESNSDGSWIERARRSPEGLVEFKFPAGRGYELWRIGLK